MNTDRDIVADLRRLDPAARISDGPLDARAKSDLARVLAQPRTSAHPAATRAAKPRRRVLVLAAGVAVAASAVVVTGLPLPTQQTGTAYAATPPLLPFELGEGAPATSAAAKIAAAAGPSTLWAEPASTQLIRTESWSLFTRVDGKTVHTAVEPQITETRRNSDGSGSKRTVIGKGSGDQPLPPGHVLSEQSYAAGQFGAYYREPLSADPARLLEQLKVGHPIDEIGTAELFVAIGDLYREQQPTPQVRAGLLTLLGERDDVISLGPVSDRAGRAGTALAVDSTYTGLPTRYVMIFDDNDGRLLASEGVLTKTAGKLNVPIPAVVSYVLWNADKP